MPIKVALMGLGAIGRGIARCALQKSELEIVAAIDLDPSRVGKKLSDVVDAPAPEVIVGSDAASEMKKAQGGVLLHATGSRLDDVEGSHREPHREQHVRGGRRVGEDLLGPLRPDRHGHADGSRPIVGS